MSLVGPYAFHVDKTPQREYRLNTDLSAIQWTKPGILPPWILHKHPPNDIREFSYWNRWYAVNWSLGLDWKIVVRNLQSLL